MNDLVGKKFNRLTVIGFSHSDRGRYWDCICDCGNKTKTQTWHLQKSRIKSCGCLRKENTANLYKTRKIPHTVLPKGVSAFNKVLYAYKRNAHKRGFEFDISKDKFKEMIKQRCSYCGHPPSNKLEDYGLNGSVTYSGIDRVNNDIGYIGDNVVPCCFNCNRMKRNMKYEDFIGHIIKIIDYTKKGHK